MSTDEILDLDVARQKMKKWRDDGYRNSDEIISLGECIILDHANKLGDELWLLYEQVCIAAFDCNRMDLALKCLRALDKQFPKSNRVLKLKAMRKEVLGQYNDAKQIYEVMLEDDPANLSIRKRLIALTKIKNDPEETISALNAYLKDFMADQEAWMELSELYIKQQEFSKAAFCMEEVMLSHPHNHLYHQRYAEIQYTINTPDSMEKARMYFAQALKLDPNNVRALYGLFLTTNSCVAKKGTDAMKTCTWTAERIANMFNSNVGEYQKQAVTEMMGSLSITN
ncbi:ER membrane protein complex subunit 2 [Hydra vulgaris]|uniref:ER membrane protein complex subunit 2 n=1 Tax=Hydra vulgaris TaxID=6087 RepID=T2MDL6_HYDVU|nr:ER membrane protein complex subunit 2 [Hydra vulgaris]